MIWLLILIWVSKAIWASIYETLNSNSSQVKDHSFMVRQPTQHNSSGNNLGFQEQNYYQLLPLSQKLRRYKWSKLPSLSLEKMLGCGEGQFCLWHLSVVGATDNYLIDCSLLSICHMPGSVPGALHISLHLILPTVGTVSIWQVSELRLREAE